MDVVTLGMAKADAKKKYAPVDSTGRIPTQAQRRDIIGSLITAGTKVPTDQTGIGNASGYTYRSSFQAAVACTDIRIHVCTWVGNYLGESVLGTTTATYKASIEFNGTYYPLTFGPSRSVTLDGWCTVASDPIALTFAKGDKFAVRLFTNTPAGGNRLAGMPGGSPNFTNGTDGFTVGDAVDSVAVPTTAGSATLFGPLAITGTLLQARVPQVAGIGDSISDGQGDGLNGKIGFGFGGWIVRAINEQLPMIRSTASADKLTVFIGNPRRLTVLQGCTHAVLALGTNDLNQDPTIPQMRARMLPVATQLAQRGMKVMVSTILPRNTSTDGFVTTANQTKPAWENKRLAYNDWLRAGAPIDPVTKVGVEIGTAGALLTGQAGHPLSQYNGANVIETADTIETARNSGIWKPADRTVSDAAITAAAATMTSATANFTAADVGKAVTIQGAGASGVAYTSVIKTFTNATTVVLTDNAATTVSAASAAIDTWTTDGVHPSTRGHQAMATALNPALITL